MAILARPVCNDESQSYIHAALARRLADYIPGVPLIVRVTTSFLAYALVNPSEAVWPPLESPVGRCNVTAMHRTSLESLLPPTLQACRRKRDSQTSLDLLLQKHSLTSRVFSQSTRYFRKGGSSARLVTFLAPLCTLVSFPISQLALIALQGVFDGFLDEILRLHAVHALSLDAPLLSIVLGIRALHASHNPRRAVTCAQLEIARVALEAALTDPIIQSSFVGTFVISQLVAFAANVATLDDSALDSNITALARVG